MRTILKIFLIDYIFLQKFTIFKKFNFNLFFFLVEECIFFNFKLRFKIKKSTEILIIV